MQFRVQGPGLASNSMYISACGGVEGYTIRVSTISRTNCSVCGGDVSAALATSSTFGSACGAGRARIKIVAWCEAPVSSTSAQIGTHQVGRERNGHTAIGWDGFSGYAMHVSAILVYRRSGRLARV